MLPPQILGADVRGGAALVRIFDPVVDASLPGGGGWLTANERMAVLRIDATATFFVAGGKEVVVDPTPGCDPIAVQTWLYGAVAMLLLGQQGGVALHATCVDVGGVVVAVAGLQGAGKSTVGLGLRSRGHHLVTDDASPIEVGPHGGDQATATVRPFGRMLHVCADTAAALGLDVLSGVAVVPGSGKLVLPAPKSGPAVLGAVVVLEVDPAASGVTAVPVPAAAAVPLLSAHAHCGSTIRRIWPKQVFAWAAAIASAVPVHRVIRPSGSWTAAETADAVERIARRTLARVGV